MCSTWSEFRIHELAEPSKSGAGKQGRLALVAPSRVLASRLNVDVFRLLFSKFQEFTMTELEFTQLAAQGFNRIPVVLETFADLDTPLSVYLKLANKPYSYL